MAGTISFDGLATGIKTQDTVAKLIEVESRPKILKEAEKARLENQLATWREINTRLLDLRGKAEDLGKISSWTTLTATSSLQDVLTATTTSSAQAGTYTFEVVRTARNHQIASQSYASGQATVGTGQVTIQVGNTSRTLEITSANNTLAGVAAAINQAGVGAAASVISDGTGYRLLVSSSETGSANAVTVTADPGISLDVSSELQHYQDAEIKFGAGTGAITITSSSNTVKDVIEGVTINLLSDSGGKTLTLTLARDTTAVTDRLKEFVNSYNNVMSYVGDQFKYDQSKGQGGILMGDPTLLRIQMQIQRLLVNKIANNSMYNSPSSVGLVLDKQGKLSFDQAKFEKAVAAGPLDVEAVFRTKGRSDHARVSFIYAGSKTAEPPAEGYAVDVTVAAQRASVTGSTLGTPLTIDESNDRLRLSLDGGAILSVSLAHQTYSTAADLSGLAADIQAKVNAAAQKPSAIVVTVEGGALRIASAAYGSASRVKIEDEGTALPNLGLMSGSEAFGVDVRGTINGESATGRGQVLVGDDGNATTSGLQLKIDLYANDLTAGSEAHVFFAKGLGTRLNEYLQGLTTPLTGTIDVKEGSLETSLTNIADRIDEMQKRLDEKKESLLAMFQRMEKAINQLNGQGNYLTSALASLVKA